MPGNLQQNLDVGTKIIMSATSDSELDGHTGMILGRSADFAGCTFYIIGLDTVHSRGDLAIQLIESCIDPVIN